MPSPYGHFNAAPFQVAVNGDAPFQQVIVGVPVPVKVADASEFCWFTTVETPKSKITGETKSGSTQFTPPSYEIVAENASAASAPVIL